ncbi:AGK family protein [Megaselia abdita]
MLKFAKKIRNNWKKTTFAVGALTYGITKAKSTYEIKHLMRAYCEEAKQYGDELQNVMYPNKKLVVVLNPAADKKNAEESVSKYSCILKHLFGQK